MSTRLAKDGLAHWTAQSRGTRIRKFGELSLRKTIKMVGGPGQMPWEKLFGLAHRQREQAGRDDGDYTSRARRDGARVTTPLLSRIGAPAKAAPSI
jgi:hypothetical protein